MGVWGCLPGLFSSSRVFYGGQSQHDPCCPPRIGVPFAGCKPVSPAIWVLGSPSAQAPIYPGLRGLEVDGPPSRGGLFFFSCFICWGVSPPALR